MELLKRSHSPLLLYRRYSPSQDTTIEVRHVFLPFLFIAILLAYFVTLSDVTALAAFALGSVLLVSYIWALNLAKGVQGKRLLISAAVQVGDEIEEEFILTNVTHLPIIWTEIMDRSTLPGYKPSMATGMGSKTERKWKKRGVCRMRGIYQMGPWEIHLGDPFGIFFVRLVIKDHQELVVYPPLADIPADLLPQRSSHGDAQFMRSFFKIDSTQAFTTRPFSEGDPLRHIHWPTTARHNELFVKGFEPESKSVIWLLPDFDSEVHTGSGPNSTEEKMVVLVASLAYELINVGMDVGLISYTDRPRVLRPSPGLGHFWQLLRILSQLHTVRDLPIGQLIRHSATIISPGTLLVPITPSLDASWLEIWNSNPLFSDTGLHILLVDPSNQAHSPAHHAAQVFAESNIHIRTVRTDDIQPIEGSYGELHRWEFKILPLGKAIAVRRPRSFTAETIRETK